MAFTANEFGRSIAAPGLVFPDQPYSTESRCMAEATESEGGFPVFAKKGEDVKVYTAKPETGGYFLGIAQRVVNRDEYPVGSPVTVVTEGQIWVSVGGDVKSGDNVGIDASGNFVAYEGAATGSLEEVKGGKFMSTAPSGSYARVVLK